MISRARSTLVSALAAGMICSATTAPSPAAVQTVSESVSARTADYQELVRIPGFDSSLGTLDSVRVRMSGTGAFTQEVENTGTFGARAHVVQELDLVLELPGRSRDILSLRQRLARGYRLSGFDGQLDFSGTSGVTYSYPVLLSGDITFTSRRVLEQFTANPFVDLYLSVEGEMKRFIPSSRGSFDFEGFVTAGADISMLYSYVAVPEPAVWTTVGAVLLGAAFMLEARAFKRLFL